MKKIFILKTAAAVLLMLAGCSGGGKDSSEHGLFEDKNTTLSSGNSSGGKNGDGNSSKENNASNSDKNGTNTGNGKDGADTNSSSDKDRNKTEISIKSISLSIKKIKLNRDTNTTLKVMAKNKDNKTIDITDKVKWLINPKDAATVNKNILTAEKDVNASVLAKYKNLLSNKVNINIYWEVSGHKLPPKPDPKMNNTTLLGTDVNNNGIRDDVERWIYGNYKKPIERGIILQEAYRLQKQISDIKKAHEYSILSDKSLSCEYYLEEKYKWFKDKYEYLDTSKKLKKIQFNTIKRYMAYEKYNAQFNGEVFSGVIKPDKKNCMFDKNGNLKEYK